MKKFSFCMIQMLALVLAACSAPTATSAPAPTAAAEQPTATLAPTITAVPTEVPPTNTPEPTATATPAPQPISAANIAGLSNTGVVEIPRQPNLVLGSFLKPSGIVGAYTPDSQHIVVRADTGVDVLSAATLEVETQYPGLQLATVLNDGRFAALHNNTLVFVEPVSGELETIETQANFSGLYAVNPTGEQAASLVDSKTVRVYSLTGGESFDIPIKNSEPPEKISFTGDGGTLILELTTTSTARFEAYEAATGAKLYEFPTYQAPQFSTDGKYFALSTFNGVIVVETATNKTLNTYNPGHIIERGCDLAIGICIDHGVNLWGNFVIGSPETTIVITKEVRSEGKPGNSLAEQGWHEVSSIESMFIADVVTGASRFVFGGYSLESLFGGFGAPDGSAFVIITKSAGLAVHSLTNGEKLAETDRYSVGGAAQLSPDGAQVGWSNLNGVYAYEWQNAKSIMEKDQPLKVSEAMFVGFLPEGRLVVETLPSGGEGLDVWNITSGSIETTLSGLNNCSADAVGAYVLCSVPSSGARRILEVNNPDRIVFSTNDPNITVLSPTGDSYATCKPGGGSITYKNYASGNVTIAQPCQPMFYRPDGLALVLQNGVVVDLPSGESTLTLEADASGKAFSAEAPAAFFGPDFIIVGNKAFDSASGKLLGELSFSDATGLALSEDGLTLNVLTGSGMEQWRVLN